MELRALRPSKGSNVVDLQSRLANKDWEALLPPALPDSLLLLLAKDFRVVEVIGSLDEDEPEPEPGHTESLAVAMFMVMNLLHKLPNRQQTGNELSIPEDGVFHAIKLYQAGLEREIVSRITGLAAEFPADKFETALLACLE